MREQKVQNKNYRQMKKREFLKAAGLVGATLVVREGVGAWGKSSKSNKGKKVVAINGR
jgi:hypothetical protein